MQSLCLVVSQHSSSKISSDIGRSSALKIARVKSAPDLSGKVLQLCTLGISTSDSDIAFVGSSRHV